MSRTEGIPPSKEPHVVAPYEQASNIQGKSEETSALVADRLTAIGQTKVAFDKSPTQMAKGRVSQELPSESDTAQKTTEMLFKP